MPQACGRRSPPLLGTERCVREARREAARAAAAADVGSLTQRELLIAGAIAYWCEGNKNKPYNRQDRVLFVNSDPGLITFFLRFLDAAGIGRERLIYRVQIHESADIAAAERYWLTLTAALPDQFRRTTLKRHNPRTVRKNVGDSYHGCLCISLWQSAELYWRIEGWARAAMAQAEGNPTTP